MSRKKYNICIIRAHNLKYILTCGANVVTINNNKGVYMSKTENIKIRLEPKEKEAFTQAAQIAGIPLSNWVRERLRLAATEELASAGRRIPFIDPIPLGGPNE
jgi:hypothetical protein